MVASDDLITLDEAAKLIPGADANTLKRMCRKGVLVCYKPGKAYLTTAANVRDAIEKSRVRPDHSEPNAQGTARLPLGLTATELANARLDAVLNGTLKRKKPRP